MKCPVCGEKMVEKFVEKPIIFCLCCCAICGKKLDKKHDDDKDLILTHISGLLKVHKKCLPEGYNTVWWWDKTGIINSIFKYHVDMK